MSIHSISDTASALNKMITLFAGSEIWVWKEKQALMSEVGSLDIDAIELGVKLDQIELTTMLGSTAFIKFHQYPGATQSPRLQINAPTAMKNVA